MTRDCALPGLAELAPARRDDRDGRACPICGRRAACRCSARGWTAPTLDDLALPGLADDAASSRADDWPEATRAYRDAAERVRRVVGP